MSTPQIPADILALQQKWDARKSLTPDELQKLGDWAIANVRKTRDQAKAEADQRNVRPDDLVAFTMPLTVLGNQFSINGIAYYGACEAPYAVFCELARNYEQDRINEIELKNRRGSKEFGLTLELDNFTIPPLSFRVTKRQEASRAA